MTERDPIPLRDAIAAVGRDLGLPAPDVLSTLARAWPELVGSTLAPHARLRSVRAGECTIEVDAPVWATQLRYLSDDLVRRCNEHCGALVVTSIRVVVARR